MASSPFKHRIETIPGDKGRMLETLYAAYPNSIPAKQLMIRAGLPFHSDPVSAFVSLCIAFMNINRLISSYGWQATRTGGTPDDRYRLTPVS